MNVLYLKRAGKYLLIAILSTYGSTHLNGQRIKSVSLQYINEQIITTPFAAQSESPAHPGGTLSYELTKKERKLYRFSQVFQAGYFHHEDFEQVVFLAWKPKYELRFANLVNIHILPGIGYAHSFATQPLYKHNGEVYNEKNNVGRPHFMPSLGAGLGVHLDWLGIPLELFIRQEYAVLFPKTRRLYLSLNSLLGAGIKYSFDLKSHEDE